MTELGEFFRSFPVYDQKPELNSSPDDLPATHPMGEVFDAGYIQTLDRVDTAPEGDHYVKPLMVLAGTVITGALLVRRLKKH